MFFRNDNHHRIIWVFFTGWDNCSVSWLSPPPSDPNRKQWENILTENKAVSIDHHQGYKNKLNNKFWKVLQFRETDHLSERSIPSVSHTPSTTSSFINQTHLVNFTKHCFFFSFFKKPKRPLRFSRSAHFYFINFLQITQPASTDPVQQRRAGLWSVASYHFKATHTSISSFLYTSAEQVSDLWEAKSSKS